MSTLLTPTIIAKEALIALENNLVLGNLVHRVYSSEFQKVGSTVTVRKPTTFTSASVDATVNMGTATESSVAVVLDQHLDVSFEVGSKELSLDVVDFSEQFIQPAMRAHAQKVDELLADLYQDVAAHTAVSATPAASDITGIRSVMNILKAPLTDRRLVFHPDTEKDYLNLDAFLHADKRGDSRAIKEASMGRVLGFDCYMDQNIPTHTPGDPTAGTATPLLKGAGASGDTSCTVDAVVSGSTVNAYDIFKVEGYDQWHVVSANATASAGTVVLTFQPAFGATRADDATVTFQRSDQRCNLAFHKNAFALVTAPLAPPLGGASSIPMNYKGLSCRCVYDYTIMEKKNVISIDLLCGVKTLDRDLAARLIDSR